MGIFLYLAWIVVILSALIIALVLVVRRGLGGVGHAAIVLLGALLMWAFLSAGIGIMDIDNYATSTSFIISIFIGIMGLCFIYLGARGLRSKYPLGTCIKCGYDLRCHTDNEKCPECGAMSNEQD